MTEARKIKPQSKRMRWAINRLKGFPSLFSTGVSVISPSCAVEGQTGNIVVEKAVQTKVNHKQVQEVSEVHVTSFPVKENWFPAEEELFPEEEKWAMLSKYDNLSRNEFLLREHVVQKEVGIAVCECDRETECRHMCLNALTSIECTPNHCPCGEVCRNQKFQKCEYARVRKAETNNRCWGLFADQDIKESDFVIEYCGEVMSDNVAQSRLGAYEAAGLKETYMMYLDGTEFLDATRKGSLARFINHSCEPNCRSRKWTVLGELRIGIFALRHIKSGEELTYDYRIQCFGGTKIKCLCGSPSCVGFLGNKFQASQETVTFENSASRASAENIGLDIFATSNRGDLSNQELLIRLYFMAVGVCNVHGLSAQLKPLETSAPVAKYELPPKMACFEFQVF